MKKYDVIVLGGGPSGMASALSLSKLGLSVLLLEKQKIATTKKTWLTFEDTIERFGLQDCVRNKFDEIIFSCYLGNSFSFSNTSFLKAIHEERALQLMAERSRQNSAILKDQEPFINYSVERAQNSIKIKSSKEEYHAELVVDAMGLESNILKSQGFNNDFVNMGCLAYMIDAKTPLKDNHLWLYDSYFPGSDYFWVVPLEENKYVVGIFFFDALNEQNIKEKKRILNLYIKEKKLNGKVYSVRMGNIPLGGQTYLNTHKILCFGDASNIPLPSSGFSFHKCLEESQIMAEFAAQYLNGSTSLKNYKKHMLKGRIPGIEIHLMISDMLSKFTDPMLNKAIGEMHNHKEEFIISFLSGNDMSIKFCVSALRAILDTFSLAELSNLSLQQNHFKNLVNLYNLLPSVSSANLGSQLIDFVRGIKKPDRSEAF